MTRSRPTTSLASVVASGLRLRIITRGLEALVPQAIRGTTRPTPLNSLYREHFGFSELLEGRS
jgi:hypothetical protein